MDDWIYEDIAKMNTRESKGNIARALKYSISSDCMIAPERERE